MAEEVGMSFLSLVSISNDRLLKLLLHGASAYEDRLILEIFLPG